MSEPILDWQLIDGSWRTVCPCGCVMSASEGEIERAERLHFINDSCSVGHLAHRIMSRTWKKEDPRLSIGKRAVIIVVDRRSPFLEASSAHVDTKEGWYIGIVGPGFDNYRTIGVDDEWPEGFVWTFAPEGGKI